MSNGSRTNFYYLSNDVICILRPADRKTIFPRVITLPHFLQNPHKYYIPLLLYFCLDQDTRNCTRIRTRFVFVYPKSCTSEM